jgi:hypothetical protein
VKKFCEGGRSLVGISERANQTTSAMFHVTPQAEIYVKIQESKSRRKQKALLWPFYDLSIL